VLWRWRKWRHFISLIDSIYLILALCSKCLCSNFMCLWHHILLKCYYFLSFGFFRANFAEIYSLYLNRPFCPSVLRHCWFGFVACKIVPDMTYCVSGRTFICVPRILQWRGFTEEDREFSKRGRARGSGPRQSPNGVQGQIPGREFEGQSPRSWSKNVKLCRIFNVSCRTFRI